MKISLDLQGIDDVIKMFDQLEKKAGKKLLTQAMRDGMKPMKAAVKEAVPVVSGTTQQAVKIKALKRSRNSFGLTVQIGEGDFKGKTFYASFPEYGSSKQPPQGNVRRAFDENKERSAQIMLASIKRGLGI